MKKKERYNYFDEFILVTDCIVKSASMLKDVMIHFNLEKLETDMNEVHKLEHEADKIIHKMRNYLIKDFLPPIDREDIALIGHKLDNIEDGIDEILINIKILDIEEIIDEANEIIDVLVICSEAVREIFLNFMNFKDIVLIKKKVTEVNKLEEKGDRIYEKLMTSLYKNEKDPIKLIKWTNVYNCLEATIDACEEVGDCIEDVIVKNS